MARYPELPILNENQRPRRNGTIRDTESTGKIAWLDPISEQWKDAVRLDDIRQKLIDQASAGGKRYKFQKHGNKDGEDPLNVTSFLSKDESYGYERKDRPDILFTLFEPKDRRSEKPMGYLMDEGRVCLDPYLHGIRDFAELPKTISAAVDGQDLEYWIRQNAQISRYDIMARMPSTCIMKGRRWVKPPSLNALTQRASRFRAKAGCLSWETNAGTENKNKYILSLLPEECKKPEVNSTKAITKDLNKKQAQVELVAVNKGKFQQKRRKAKRTKEPEVKDEGDTPNPIPAQSSPGPEILGTERKRKRSMPEKPKISGQNYDTKRMLSGKRRKADAGTPMLGDKKRADGLPEIMPTRRSSRRATRTAVAYQESEDEGEAQPSDIDTKKEQTPQRHQTGLMITPNRSPAARISAREPQVTASLKSCAPTGIVARYVIDVDDNPKPAYDADFVLESEAALNQDKADLRYRTPTDAAERAHIRRALELTCIDFCALKGHAAPGDLLITYHHESYESQHRRIQKEFDRLWCGAKRAPMLYRLPAWTGSVGDWRVPKDDEQGQILMWQLRFWEKNAENMDLV